MIHLKKHFCEFLHFQVCLLSAMKMNTLKVKNTDPAFHAYIRYRYMCASLFAHILMPKLNYFLPVLFVRLVSKFRIQHSENDATKMSSMVKHLPTQDNSKNIKTHKSDHGALWWERVRYDSVHKRYGQFWVRVEDTQNRYHRQKPAWCADWSNQRPREQLLVHGAYEGGECSTS